MRHPQYTDLLEELTAAEATAAERVASAQALLEEAWQTGDPDRARAEERLSEAERDRHEIVLQRSVVQARLAELRGRDELTSAEDELRGIRDEYDERIDAAVQGIRHRLDREPAERVWWRRTLWRRPTRRKRFRELVDAAYAEHAESPDRIERERELRRISDDVTATVRAARARQAAALRDLHELGWSVRRLAARFFLNRMSVEAIVEPPPTLGRTSGTESSGDGAGGGGLVGDLGGGGYGGGDGGGDGGGGGD